MLVKYYLSDNIKTPFENFALGLTFGPALPNMSHSHPTRAFPLAKR